MRYQANPVMADAWKITAVGVLPDKAGCMLTLAEGQPNFFAPEAMTSRMQPQPGDYLVRQDDGYLYLNPAQVFERKYSVSTGKPLEDAIRAQSFTAGEALELIALVKERAILPTPDVEPNALELGAAVRRAGLAGQ